MSRSDVYRTIEVQTEALGPVLFSGVATSLTAAHQRRQGLEHSKYPHLLPLLLRTELREFLDVNPMPPGWVVGGDSRKMGQLLLTHEKLNLEMRVLKERRSTYPNGVPVAGSSAARRCAWKADPLDLIWPNVRADVPASRQATDPVRLLLVWDFAPGTQLRQFTLRVVHTTDPGVYGKEVPCDLVLDVKDGGEIFKLLEFTGSNEEHDFFHIDLDEEGNESAL